MSGSSIFFGNLFYTIIRTQLKTQETAVLVALKNAAKHWGCDLVDYTTAADLSGLLGRYVIFVEVRNPEKITGITSWQAILQKALEEANPRYRAAIEARRVGGLLLQVVQPGTFYRLQKELMSRGASANQVKIPRVLKDESLISFLSESTLKVGNK